MEDVYLKEIKRFSISEILDFRQKHVELVNKKASESNGVKNRKTRSIKRLSTWEKVKQKRSTSAKVEKKLKKESKELPALLPIYLPDSAYTSAPNLDLKPGKDVVFLFRVYMPFTYYREKTHGKPKPAMEIAMLGHQTLNLLCDKIICREGYMEVGGDISETPDVPVKPRLMDKYKSRMLYIGNNFYVDNSDPNNQDYSETIRKWGEQHNLTFGDTLDMHKQSCLDLVARIGYPYVYQHIGGCEHLIRIMYARLIEPEDCLESIYYPFYHNLPRHNNVTDRCMACVEITKWIVFDSPRMISNPSFLCDNCFRSYHYIDGRKIGSFSAVRYWHSPKSVKETTEKSNEEAGEF